MKCPRCGFELKDGLVFCTRCGTQLKQASSEGPEPAPSEAETAPEVPSSAPVRRFHQSGESAPVDSGAPQDPHTPREQYTPPIPARPVSGRLPAPQGRSARKNRSAGPGAGFWMLMLLLLPVLVYTGLCVVMPDSPITAPAVNLALTVWNYFTSWKDALWFLAALGGILLLAILRAVLSAPLRRALHAADREEERELTGRVVVAETLAPPQQVYAEIEDILQSRKTRKQYFPRRGTIRLADFSAGGVPLEYRCGKDAFTAHFVFQRMERAGTRIFLEIIRWQKKDGVIAGACLQAMRALEPMLRDAVLDIDSGASFREYGC